MLGQGKDQRGLFEADHLYLDMVGRESFYGFLASQRGRLFRDEEFAALYVLDNGRPSVPPSLLATALLLQAHDGVSDAEAKGRADFDLRWKVALGVAVEERPFAKSTLQLFRAQLILHEKLQAIFLRSLEFARQNGFGRGGKVRVVLDTTYIFGRGAVKDTYNLLGDGITRVVRVLADSAGVRPQEWAKEHQLARYFASSVKGEAGVDWDSATAREQFLRAIVADADRVLDMVRQRLAEEAQAEAGGDGGLAEAASLLGQLLLQDIERREEGAALRQGVARDRIVSVQDPEMRHGRKSAAKLFDGYKAAVAVDGDSGIIMATTVLAGNAPDNEGALALVEAAESNAQVQVEETVGDCAYGDGQTRQEFADVGRRLVAKVPAPGESDWFGKEAFAIDVASQSCTCPAGELTTKLVLVGRSTDRKGKRHKQQSFEFDTAVCHACALRGQCLRGKSGRRVRLHRQEKLLQQARALQHSEEFAPYRILRQAGEHRLARLTQLGVRQARYFGRAKTWVQVLLAATVANLTLIAGRMGLMKGRQGSKHAAVSCPRALIRLLLTNLATVLDHCLPLVHLSYPRTVAFRPDF